MARASHWRFNNLSTQAVHLELFLRRIVALDAVRVRAPSSTRTPKGPEEKLATGRERSYLEGALDLKKKTKNKNKDKKELFLSRSKDYFQTEPFNHHPRALTPPGST